MFPTLSPTQVVQSAGTDWVPSF